MVKKNAEVVGQAPVRVSPSQADSGSRGLGGIFLFGGKAAQSPYNTEKEHMASHEQMLMNLVGPNLSNQKQ